MPYLIIWTECSKYLLGLFLFKKMEHGQYEKLFKLWRAKMKPYITTIIAILLFNILGSVPLAAEDPSLTQAVFYVKWYTVGKAALEGLPGVKKVTVGFKGFKEINTVTFDASLITPDEMVDALKAADTFIGKVKEHKWQPEGNC